MPKKQELPKPKQELSKHVGDKRKELYRAAKYHWEFKRRNEGYRLWWQQGAKAKVKPKGWDERFDPDISFDELIKSEAEKALSGFQHPQLKILLSKNQHRSIMSSVFEYLFMQGMLPKSVEQEIGPGWMTIKINFNKVKSISALREYVSLLIKDVYSLSLKGGLLSRSDESQAGRTKKLNRNFDRIITAGDSRRERKTYAQIAKDMFPKTIDSVTGEASDIAEREVKRYVAEYKKLVDNGYLGITYP